jgi:phage shock protein PspC (stress-responsive transcriptional regulator)
MHADFGIKHQEDIMQKRLHRSQKERMLGGVCGGLAEYFETDPSLIRLIFALMFVFGGTGLLLYLILWIILPVEDRTYASPQDIARENAQEIADRARKFGEDVKTAVQRGSTSHPPETGHKE